MAERLMKTVFDWEHFAIYLSGAIDFASDGGKGWRDVWMDKLVEIGINRQQIYNPCRKPCPQFHLDDEAAIAERCRQEKDWQQLYDVMGQVMHMDLRLLDKSDIVLVNMPRIGYYEPTVQYLQETMPKLEDDEISPVRLAIHDLCQKYATMRVPTYGTIHEIVVAHLQRKPIFMVWEETGLKDCSAWLMRLIGYKNIFAHIEYLIEHLAAISQGKESFNANEWLLIDPNGV